VLSGDAHCIQELALNKGSQRCFVKVVFFPSLFKTHFAIFLPTVNTTKQQKVFGLVSAKFWFASCFSV